MAPSPVSGRAARPPCASDVCFDGAQRQHAANGENGVQTQTGKHLSFSFLLSQKQEAGPFNSILPLSPSECSAARPSACIGLEKGKKEPARTPACDGFSTLHSPTPAALHSLRFCRHWSAHSAGAARAFASSAPPSAHQRRQTKTRAWLLGSCRRPSHRFEGGAPSSQSMPSAPVPAPMPAVPPPPAVAEKARRSESAIGGQRVEGE